MNPWKSLPLAAALAGFLLPLAARAEVLTGRIFLGPGMSLYLERDEGLFTEVLRALHLVEGEVPVIDLKAMELSKEHLFLSRENGVYVRDEDRALHRIGRWDRPGEIRLDPGVELRGERTLDEFFEGEKRDSLVVRLASGDRPADGPVEEADLAFWLGYLSENYIPGAMLREDEEDVSLVLNAVLGGLPTGPDPGERQAENLLGLKAWLTDHPYHEVDAVRALIRQAQTRLNAAEVHGGADLDDAGRETIAQLRSFYDRLLAAVDER